jgi:hypothetical protein
VKKPGRPKGRHTPWSEPFIDRVLRKYPGIDKLLGDTSISMREIAELYGINRESVRRMERGFGLTPRREARRMQPKPKCQHKTSWTALSAESSF